MVDLFGALTRAELQAAAAELSFKREGEFDPETFTADVDAAVRSFHLLVVPADAVSGEATAAADGAPEWLVPGPAAFPELPSEAGDLPHILDAEERTVDRETAALRAEQRFRAEAAAALDAGDDNRIAALRDVSYELETWAGVDLSGVRTRLDG